MPATSLRRAVLKRVVGYPAALGVVLAVFWRVSIWMPGTSPSGPLLPLTAAEDALRARLRADIDSLAVAYAGRSFATDALDSASAFVSRRLVEAGHAVNVQSY